MSRFFKATLTVCLFTAELFAPNASHAWGREGHETIGYIAEQLIANTHAQTEVAKLLQGDEDLASAAEWADCAKGYMYCHEQPTDEMKTYAANNKRHHQFHYTDIPVEEKQYTSGSAGADPEDIVQILTEAIVTLQGSTTNIPHHFTQREALFLIAHLVGDIHQPLHVGAVYIGDDLTFGDPHSKSDFADGGTLHATQGSNLLMVGSKGLHGLWDTDYVKSAMSRVRATSPDEFATDLVDQGLAKPKQSGAAATWPMQWANETLALAQKELLLVTPSEPEDHESHGTLEQVWPIDVPPSYRNNAVAIVPQQLWRAGSRLASVLQAIWP